MLIKPNINYESKMSKSKIKTINSNLVGFEKKEMKIFNILKKMDPQFIFSYSNKRKKITKITPLILPSRQKRKWHNTTKYQRVVFKSLRTHDPNCKASLTCLNSIIPITPQLKRKRKHRNDAQYGDPYMPNL